MNPSLYSEEELHRRCAQVRAELLDSAEGRLNFGQVMSVLSVYGKKPNEYGDPYSPDASEEEKALALQGRQRRRWNAVLCGEKIVHLWSFELVQEYLSHRRAEQLRFFDPHRHLRQAKHAVRNNEEFPIVDFDPSPDDVSYALYEIKKTSVPIYQAVSTYSTIWHILFTVSADDLNIFDVELHYPPIWSGEYTGNLSIIRASYAYGGMNYPNLVPLNDPHLLREFWLWWLDEAVPASWYLRDL